MRSVPAYVLLLAAPLQAQWNFSTLTEAPSRQPARGAAPAICGRSTTSSASTMQSPTSSSEFAARLSGTSAANRNYGQLLQRSAVYRPRGL